MADLKLKRRGGFGKVKPSAIKFVSCVIADEAIESDPWACFASFALAARLKHVAVERLTFAEARPMPGGRRHLFLFSVDPS